MTEVNSGCDFQELDEESSITGGKSVSEIVQILRIKANLKTKGSSDENTEDSEDQPNKTNQIFPWIKKFTAQCKEVIPNPDIRKLDELITTFLKHIEESVKECYKRPKRAYKLRLRMNSFLQLFTMIYGELKEPLEHTAYLDKMSDIMALYIDIELKSSRRGREHPKKISERICTSLYIFLDKSMDHILDAVLKARFFIKKYSDICCPIMARLLKESTGQLYETTYVRYLLSFKLWKKLAGKDHYASINKEAVAKLKPPADFADRLKCGLFSNVLPYVSKSEKDRITLFFMQSPFNVKKKAQVFLKDEKKIQPQLEYEKCILLEDDTPATFFEDDSDEGDNSPAVMMEDIWRNLVDREDDCFDNYFIPMDILEPREEEENIIIDLRNTKVKEKSKKVSKNKTTNGVLKTSMKKRKALKVNNNNIVKNVINKAVVDLVRNDLAKPIIPVIPKEEIPAVSCIKTEDPSSCLSNSPEPKSQKPCATVEPEQCKEVTDSLCKNIEILPAKLIQNSISSCTDSLNREGKASGTEDQSNDVETTATHAISNLGPAIINTTMCSENSSEIIPTTTADSSGICEENKGEVNCNDLVVDEAFKDMKQDDSRLLEESFVAEEVVIGSDMEPDTGCTIYLSLGGDEQEKLDQADIMNVIGITRDSTAFCSDAVVINSDMWTKDQEKQHQAGIDSLLENNSTSLNSSKDVQIKEQSSVSPENQFLSSIIASSEGSDNYVSLYRRQDSYTCNEIMLTRLFSESTTVDDGSDEDGSPDQNRSRFAGGGKRPPFRDHMEESKSDCGEEFEPLSPSSRSDSQQRSPMEASPEMINSQSAAIECSPQDSDQEMKSSPPNSMKGEISPQAHINCEEKSSPPDYGQLKELSVNLSLGDLNNVNDYLLGKEKISHKGKRGSSRHSSSHHSKKKSPPIQGSPDSDNEETAFSLDQSRLLEETNSDEGELKQKPSKARSVSSSKSKSKTRQPSPIPTKPPPPQPVAKKRRSKRRR